MGKESASLLPRESERRRSLEMASMKTHQEELRRQELIRAQVNQTHILVEPERETRIFAGSSSVSHLSGSRPGIPVF